MNKAGPTPSVWLSQIVLLLIAVLNLRSLVIVLYSYLGSEIGVREVADLVVVLPLFSANVIMLPLVAWSLGKGRPTGRFIGILCFICASFLLLFRVFIQGTTGPFPSRVLSYAGTVAILLVLGYLSYKLAFGPAEVDFFSKHELPQQKTEPSLPDPPPPPTFAE